jgi:DNA repair protein RadC
MLTIKVIKERGPERHYGAVKRGVDVYKVMKFLEQEDRENLYALHLDAENAVIGRELISCGTLTQSVIHAREVFKGAILNNSASIILVHNHPSGNTQPSNEDITTRRLKEAGKLLGIVVLDHIIIGGGQYFSFLESGTLKEVETPRRGVKRKYNKLEQLIAMFRTVYVHGSRSQRASVCSGISTAYNELECSLSGKTQKNITRRAKQGRML